MGMSVQDKFEAYHRKHPDVYVELVKLCRMWRSRGRDKWSIWSAVAVARWERRFSDLPNEEEKYTISNDFTTFYARFIAMKEHDLADLFTLKATKHYHGFSAQFRRDFGID